VDLAFDLVDIFPYESGLMPGPKSFVEVLDGGYCKYIISDPKIKPTEFCTIKRRGNSPYCDRHTSICYLPEKSPVDE
jgi:hypothetical protein